MLDGLFIKKIRENAICKNTCIDGIQGTGEKYHFKDTHFRDTYPGNTNFHIIWIHLIVFTMETFASILS